MFFRGLFHEESISKISCIPLANLKISDIIFRTMCLKDDRFGCNEERLAII